MKPKYWNLSDATDARDFLKSLRLGPKQAAITFLQTESGAQIKIEDASDQQILGLVSQIAKMMEDVGRIKKRDDGKLRIV